MTMPSSSGSHNAVQATGACFLIGCILSRTSRWSRSTTAPLDYLQQSVVYNVVQILYEKWPEQPRFDFQVSSGVKKASITVAARSVDKSNTTRLVSYRLW